MASGTTRRIVRAAIALGLGLLVGGYIGGRPVLLTAMSKLVGCDEACPWGPLLRSQWSIARFGQLQDAERAGLRKVEEDAALGLELYETRGGRPFWIQKHGELKDGGTLLAYVLAEQRWISEHSPAYGVQPGDVVVDVGAHVGTFDDDALRRGAARVVLVEPDPVNVEAIRRNYRKEIAAGTVVLIPEGAWSSRATLPFSTGVANSGMGTFLEHERGARTIDVPVRPLDEMLAEAGIHHVDFVKLDIEGAEREALKGAARILARDKPVLMVDAYHRPDDAVVIPAVIRQGNPAYVVDCTLCAPPRAEPDHITPYVFFFH